MKKDLQDFTDEIKQLNRELFIRIYVALEKDPNPENIDLFPEFKNYKK